VRPQRELILRFAGDAVHLREDLGGDAHHPAAFATCLLMEGLGSTPWVMGMWPMCSTPPTMKTSPLSVMIAMAAVCSALMEEPQRRLIVWALAVVRDGGHQRGEARDVEALFQGLLGAAPDHVLDLGGIDPGCDRAAR
jgi:hypothetical protein